MKAWFGFSVIVSGLATVIALSVPKDAHGLEAFVDGTVWKDEKSYERANALITAWNDTAAELKSLQSCVVSRGTRALVERIPDSNAWSAVITAGRFAGCRGVISPGRFETPEQFLASEAKRRQEEATRQRERETARVTKREGRPSETPKDRAASGSPSSQPPMSKSSGAPDLGALSASDRKLLFDIHAQCRSAAAQAWLNNGGREIDRICEQLTPEQRAKATEAGKRVGLKAYTDCMDGAGYGSWVSRIE